MFKTVIKIEGMMCGMCEAHVNEAVHAAVSAEKVSSSHKKGTTELITEKEPDENKLREAVEKDGYKVLGITTEPYEKKGLFRKK
ncbi:MAG: cation transporter [Ruminococcus sp.]|nr:cation transporter [Ruminococcus sp.]